MHPPHIGTAVGAERLRVLADGADAFDEGRAARLQDAGDFPDRGVADLGVVEVMAAPAARAIVPQVRVGVTGSRAAP